MSNKQDLEQNCFKRLASKFVVYKKLTAFELLSLLLSLIGLASIVALLFQTMAAMEQTQSLSDTLEKTATYNISTREFELNKLLFDHPRLQPYFFSREDISEDHEDYSRVAVIAGLRVDFAGLMHDQSDVVSDSGRQVLSRYIRHLFTSSPIMCKHLNKDAELYSEEFVKLARQGCHQK